MNAGKICAWLLILALLCGSVPAGLAEQPESPAISSGSVKYLQDGCLYEPFDGSTVLYCDYATGECRPLCTRPGCDHRPMAETGAESFYDSVPEMMNDPSSGCYAARFAQASQDNAYVMYNRKLYFFPAFLAETNTLPLYVSEPDGETRLLADLGDLFSADCIPFAWEMLAYDGYLYIEIHEFANPGPEETAENLPVTIRLVRCSMDTGEASVMESFRAEYSEFHFIGLYDGILYYYISMADNIGPVKTEKEYWQEIRRKARYSVQGIDTVTGEKVVPDPRLCGRSQNYGENFDIVKDGILYSIVLPETAEDPTALFLGYDLNRREKVLEYSFAYDAETDFYPYRVLTDEIVLAFSFQAGTFALRNLKTGELRPLNIPGACFFGNDGKTDWYDIYDAYFQTDPLVLEHFLSETEFVKAYVTAEELLKDNPRIRDFTER